MILRKRISENEAAHTLATLGALCTAVPKVHALPESSPEDFRARPRTLPTMPEAGRHRAGRGRG